MKIDTNDIMACSRKVLIFLIRRTCRSACEHPFVLGMLFFLLMLYIFLPYVFALLVSSSPVIICTMLLLGTLLSFGQPNIPEIEEEKTTDELSTLQVCSAASDLIVKADERFSMESCIKSEKVRGTSTREVNLTEQVGHVCKVERGALLSTSTEEEERKDEAVGICSSLKWDKDQIHINKKATDKRDTNGRARLGKAESLEEYVVQDAQQVRLMTSGEEGTDNLNGKAYESTMERGFDSSPDSSQKLGYSHVASDSCSDHTDSHTPDASLTGIIPTLDELRPLIDYEAPCLVNTYVDDSHVASGSFVQACKYDDNAEEESKERKEVTQEKKHDESAIRVTCTADDEKNHMDLSTSILERSRRLKSLIIKRRARKNLRAEVERSLRGLDVNKTASIMDNLSHIQLRISPVSTARQDPFDLPFYSEESSSLLQIPGSAPSAFLPRGNLFDEFDLPYDQEDENGALTGMSPGHQGSLSLLQKEMLFRRYESFSVGASFTGDPKQEKHNSKLKADFGTGRTDLEDARFADFQRQLSDRSFSKVASVPGSESNSSVVNMECNELLEEELHQKSHAELIFPCDIRHVRRKSDSSDEVDFVESESSEREVNICGICKTDTSIFKAFEEKTPETFDDFVEYEMKIRREMDLHTPTADAANSDSAELKYMESISTCSLEVGEDFSTKIEERSTDLQQSAGNHLKAPNHSVNSFDGEGESLNDIHVVHSVHDSSTSVTGKPLLNIASSDFNSKLPIASETQETLHPCSQRLEGNSSLEVGSLVRGEMHMSDNGAPCVLP